MWVRCQHRINLTTNRRRGGAEIGGEDHGIGHFPDLSPHPISASPRLLWVFLDHHRFGDGKDPHKTPQSHLLQVLDARFSHPLGEQEGHRHRTVADGPRPGGNPSTNWHNPTMSMSCTRLSSASPKKPSRSPRTNHFMTCSRLGGSRIPGYVRKSGSPEVRKSLRRTSLRGSASKHTARVARIGSDQSLRDFRTPGLPDFRTEAIRVAFFPCPLPPMPSPDVSND